MLESKKTIEQFFGEHYGSHVLLMWVLVDVHRRGLQAARRCEVEACIVGPDAHLSTSEICLLLGCKPATWRALVARRQAPPPVEDMRSGSGERLWDAGQFLRWMAVRPGRGNHARGRKRTSPQTRTRPYSVGGDPGWRA